MGTACSLGANPTKGHRMRFRTLLAVLTAAIAVAAGSAHATAAETSVYKV
jgi:hypothetical protein